MYGKIYIVSTPIGNLDDITCRAVNILKGVDLIACEDTRNTKKLLSKYRIENELISYHEHNEVQRSIELLEKLKNGKNIAVVSDAGTPCISDPGHRIVKLAAEHEIGIIPVPGASALISALSISGISSDSFSFFGFFPKKQKKGLELLEDIKESSQTAVFYESPKRVIKTLGLILETVGNRNISVSREITKVYEETLRGTVKDVLNKLEGRETVKGEFVVVIEGADRNKKVIRSEELREQLKVFYEENVSVKTAVDIYSKIFDIPKNKVYEAALKIWGN